MTGQIFNPTLTDVTDDEMLDTLEQQFERGEPLNPEFVWELLNRGDARVVELDRLRARAAAVQRAFIACNRDRRFAWNELRHENERAVKAQRERTRLRAVVETFLALLDEPMYQHGAVNIHEGLFKMLAIAARDVLDGTVVG